MKTYTTLNIGHFHTNYCEDFWVTSPVTKNQQLIAVTDGCTMGTESAFAAMLLGKILRQIAKELYYEDFRLPSPVPLDLKLEEILKRLFSRLKAIKNQLGLDTHEMLSTLVLGLVDEQSLQAELIVIGDGLICYDGNLLEFEQNDRPDYLAYHLGTDFGAWYQAQSQHVSIKDFRDLSISTDGIFSFKNFVSPSEQKKEEEIIDFLLVNVHLSEHNNFLERKMRFIRERWQHEVTDDLAIVRMITS
ncbi:MAG: protein phosphatase 2C domain-containing protein [Roseivirga sp.]|nr:protein phosphatase 2C domain-containing protein [Roseivirga sp.]